MASITTAIGSGLGVCLSGLCARASTHFVGKEEQLIVEGFTETVAHNGPTVVVLSPLGYRRAKKVKAQKLGNLDYIRVNDAISGEDRIERGPKLLFLGAYDSVVHHGVGVTLSETEYLFTEDQLSGEKTMVRGPRVWFPSTHETHTTKKAALALEEDQYVRLKDESTGRRWIQKGKALLFPEPTWKIEGRVSKAWTLKAYEYVRLLDNVTGKITVLRGEQIVFPGPDQELLDSSKLSAIDLQVDEYVKIENQTNGDIRVLRGTERVFLGPHERVLEDDDCEDDQGKRRAVQVDEEHAVLVRDIGTGQLRLVTEKQLFVPGPYEAIEEVRELIKLADHDAMIIKDKDGNFHYRFGNPDKQSGQGPRSFFLQPYEEIVELLWSSGLRRKNRDLHITRFDCRAQYMWIEIDCRTSDNVELVLETTFFWEAMDLPKLVRTTGNLPGDIYNQARSQFIKCVAQKTLKEFMSGLHSISKEVFEQGTPFYEERGIKVHSLEVTKYSCAEKRTSEVLQQIIEETTNRLNRLSHAESENEVNLFKIQGDIEREKLNGELLEIQHEHAQSEARVAGAAEAERVKAFLAGLEGGVPELDDRVGMWQVLRKTEALSVVSEGGASLYYTPSDVNLSIKTETRQKAPAKTGQ